MANIKAAVHVCIYMFRFSSNMKRRKTHPLGPWISKHTDDFADLFAMWCGRSPWFTFGHSEFEMFLHQKRPNMSQPFLRLKWNHQRAGTIRRHTWDFIFAPSFMRTKMFDNTRLPVCKGMTMNLANEAANPQVVVLKRGKRIIFYKFSPRWDSFVMVIMYIYTFLFLCVVVFVCCCFFVVFVFLLKVFRCYMFLFFYLFG